LEGRGEPVPQCGDGTSVQSALKYLAGIGLISPITPLPSPKSSGVDAKEGIQMDTSLKTMIWQQFGASIDMLDDAIKLCPDQLWTAILWRDPDDVGFGQFWYVAYHTLFWLDLYLTGFLDGFAPPAPFIRDGLPEEPYTKDQILAYLDQCRRKCQSTFEGLTDEKAHQRCTFKWFEASFLELQLYNMRHVQEHAGQLSLLLGQHDVPGIDWVTKAREY
jgi:hypothetical protein